MLLAITAGPGYSNDSFVAEHLCTTYSPCQEAALNRLRAEKDPWPSQGEQWWQDIMAMPTETLVVYGCVVGMGSPLTGLMEMIGYSNVEVPLNQLN